MDGYYNYKRNKKTFLITKLPDESELTKEIKISFEDPEKFLKINPSMIVGRLIKGPRMDEDFKIIPHSVVGSASAIEDLQIQKRNTNSLLKYSAKVSSSTLPSIKKDDKIKKPNFDSIDDHKLKSIYQEFQAKKYRNKDKTNDFMKSVPDHITSKLKLQENRLSTFQDEENKVLKLTKKIAKKSKKNVEDLLMNRTDASRLKREIHEIMECKKPFEEKYGNFSWNVSLRRPKNFIGTRHTYLNFGNDINPLWLSIKETIPKYAEIVRKPDQKLDEEFKTLTTNDYLMTTVQTCESVNLNHLQNIKDLELEGKDLLKVEIENSQNLGGKKILYKNDYLNSLSLLNFNSNQSTSVGFVNNNDKKLTTPQNYVTHYDAVDFYKKSKILKEDDKTVLNKFKYK